MFITILTLGWVYIHLLKLIFLSCSGFAAPYLFNCNYLSYLWLSLLLKRCLSDGWHRVINSHSGEYLWRFFWVVGGGGERRKKKRKRERGILSFDFLPVCQILLDYFPWFRGDSLLEILRLRLNHRLSHRVLGFDRKTRPRSFILATWINPKSQDVAGDSFHSYIFRRWRGDTVTLSLSLSLCLFMFVLQGDKLLRYLLSVWQLLTTLTISMTLFYLASPSLCARACMC